MTLIFDPLKPKPNISNSSVVGLAQTSWSQFGGHFDKAMLVPSWADVDAEVILSDDRDQ